MGTGLSRVFGLLPVPLSEWVVGAGVLGPLFWLAATLCRRQWRKAGRGLCKLIFCLCAAILWFVFFYGVHHTAPPLTEKLNLEVAPYSQDQLEAFVDYAVAQVNLLAGQVPRQGEDCDFGSFRELAKLADQEYAQLAERYPVYDRMRPGLVKRSLVGGRIMSLADLAGYYFPFTGESVVSSDVVQTHIPFDIAHELAHGLGIGPEAECNFSAFLACSGSADLRLQYSGWLCAYVYANNGLYAMDPAASSQRTAALCDLARHDLWVLNENLRRFEGPLNNAGSAVNDALIKATGQPDGVASYGKVADLLLAWFYWEHR